MLVCLGALRGVQLFGLRSRTAGRARHRPDADRRRCGSPPGDRAGVVVVVCNQDRGVPVALLVVGVLFVLWTYVLNRTKFGRHIYAVGGNAEAARRAGINVDNVRIACFAIVSMMAVIGGIILASACGRSTRTRAAARRCCTRSPRRSSAAPRCSAGAAR